MSRKPTRRIPMQTPERSRVGFKQQHYLPLKLNASGVIAIIFAQSLMILPMVIPRSASAMVAEDDAFCRHGLVPLRHD